MTIIASGILVDEALKAEEQLAAKGISARVIDMHTWKPLDAELILKAAKETGAIVTAENHQVSCGLGSAVSNVLTDQCLVPLERIGIQEQFGQVGPQDYLMEQYHLLDKKLPGVTNANCWAHARRAFADAVKAADKKDPLSVKNSVAYQALQKIAEFYRIDTELKELPATDRLTQRQTRIKPLVEDFFAWAKQQAAECTVPPKSRTGQGLNFVIHQEKYLKIFLTDGDIPIDNSASERAIRTFCIGKKNWMFHNTAKGAGASALVYSISETAKLNNLRPYYYFRHILTELPKYCDEKGNIDPAKLDQLMPWAEELPEECRNPRRS